MRYLTFSTFTNFQISNPINCQFWHHSCIQLEELPQDMVSHPYLIFRNKQDIKDFLVFLTFSYHWETLYKPHCQLCWVQFTHAGHVILQLILYKLWSKTLLQAFQPYKLPILTSQLHPAWRATQDMVSHPYLIFRNKQDIKDFLFLLTFSYHWETLYKPHCQLVLSSVHPCWSCHSAANTLQVMKQNIATRFPTL